LDATSSETLVKDGDVVVRAFEMVDEGATVDATHMGAELRV
jgi:hypothetical protein